MILKFCTDFVRPAVVMTSSSVLIHCLAENG